MPIAPEIVRMFQFIDSSKQKFIDDLKEPVEIQSVSTNKRYRDEVKRMVNWCEKWFIKLKIKYECFASGLYTDDEGENIRLPPIIFASLGQDKQKKTLCIYSHLDVVDANPEEWETDPWTLVEKDGKLFGRGVSRNKGPLLCWLHAIEAYYFNKIDLPVNLKFIISSTHEYGSLGLDKLLFTQRLLFLKNIDFFVLNESTWLTPSMPCITYAACGICHFAITCSINSGSSVSTPEEVLDKIFSYLGDSENNAVHIPGFNEDVGQMNPDEERLLENVACKLDDLKKTLPPSMQEWSQARLLMSFWILPSIYFSEIEKCKCSGDNQSAVRKFILKIVPQQTPERVNQFVWQYIPSILRYIFQDKEVEVKTGKTKTKYAVKSPGNDNSEIDVTCQMTSGSRPWSEDLQSISYRACALSTKQVYKDEASMIRLCNDVEIILILKRITGKNILCLPMCNSDANINEPNENISYRNYFEGTKLLAAYFWNLGALIREEEE